MSQLSASGHATARPERAAPFVLDTRSLGRRPGAMKAVHKVVPAPARTGLDLIAVPQGAPIELDLRLESVQEGVLVTGAVRAEAEGDCVRCLEPLVVDVDIPITELFAYPNSVTDQTTDEDELHRVVDDLVDLAPVIDDAIGLDLPLQPLCEEDCPGLCPKCGIRLAIAESGHNHEIIDDRWAALIEKFGSSDSEAAESASAPPLKDVPGTNRAQTDEEN